ncbi:Carboxypeptidase N catalytic chain [Thelohanellus kitauei]|uniref:Carboxypeptidase N catalytic chain n=1 Tax=Thelohanellus kitauei TaxID=669202 RepID=A0A0C2MFF1_THEKT|nr:Carboxypeptidase N catalytic chain [Thelohanellus kitauei]
MISYQHCRPWFTNSESVLACFSALRGIKGMVVDSNNNPLKDVHISISDRKHDVKTAVDGDYWRLVLPGTYEVTARLRGYDTQTRIVTVENALATWINFTLFKTAPDPSVNALGHVSPFQKSLNLMIFESDGRDSPDSDDHSEEEVDQKHETSSESDADEIRGFDYSIDSKLIKSQPKEPLAYTKPKYTLPANQINSKKEEMKPFKNVNPDFTINEMLTCQIPGRTQNLSGKLKWSGTIPELANHTSTPLESIILGLELMKSDDLATDGTFLGKRYFTTKPNHAYFIPKNLCKRI